MDSDILKARMLENHVRAPQLAEALHLSPQAVYKKINGHSVITVGEFFTIRDMLKLSEEDCRKIFI